MFHVFRNPSLLYTLTILKEPVPAISTHLFVADTSVHPSNESPQEASVVVGGGAH